MNNPGLRQDMSNQEPLLAYLSLMEISNSLNELADLVEGTDADVVISQEQLEVAADSISTNGLPQFELDHLNDSGFSTQFVDTFTDLHFQGAPDGSGFTATSTSQAIRDVADEFFTTATDLDNQLNNGTDTPPIGLF